MMNLTKLFFVSFVAITVRAKPLSDGSKQTFIVGGNNATPHEFPWLVSLRASLGDMHLCGGVILDSRTVLTTGACTDLLTPFYSTVAAGKHNLTADEKDSQQIVQVSSIHVHPQFAQNSDYSNDIAIIKVNPGYYWNEYVSPIAKFQESYEIQTESATIAGWGTKREESIGLEEILQKASVRLIENNMDCQLLVGSLVTVEDSMICIASPSPNQPIDSCSNDEGGPLIEIDEDDQTPTLLGLISFGIGCGRVNLPSFCTRVSPYLDFIKQYMES